MMDAGTFERLLDGLFSEIEDLPDGSAKTNLIGIADSLYNVFENLDCEEPEKIQGENETMRKILANRLSDDEKRYVKIKYGIDLYEGVTGHEWTI